MSLLLAALLCLQETPEKLVERLRADSIEEREGAIKTLTDWGDKARPVLVRAAEDADKEVAARAKAILAAIDARQAQAEYRKIEAAFFSAKSARIRFKSVLTSKGQEPLTVAAGTLLFAPGDRVMVQVNPKGPDGLQHSLIVSDGRTVFSRNRQRTHGGEATFDAPATLGTRLRATFLNEGGELMTYVGLPSSKADLDRFLVPDDGTSMQKLGRDGALATIFYAAVTDTRETRSTYWYDPTTCALVKRVTVFVEDGKETTHTETYEEFTFPPELPENAFDRTFWSTPLATAAKALPGVTDVKDGTPIETDDAAYRSMITLASQCIPERLREEAGAVDYSFYAEKPAAVRGRAVRLNLLFLQSNPIHLEKKIGSVEWVHRTYLCNPTAAEGYVVDLIEAPPDVAKRSPVAVDALFLKRGAYEGQKGMVEAPFLIGRSLTAVPEK